MWKSGCNYRWIIFRLVNWNVDPWRLSAVSELALIIRWIKGIYSDALASATRANSLLLAENFCHFINECHPRAVHILTNPFKVAKQLFSFLWKIHARPVDSVALANPSGEEIFIIFFRLLLSQIKNMHIAIRYSGLWVNAKTEQYTHFNDISLNRKFVLIALIMRRIKLRL